MTLDPLRPRVELSPGRMHEKAPLNLGVPSGLVRDGWEPCLKADPRCGELYASEHDRAFRVGLALGHDRGRAEDATQEAFARALERWTRLRERPWAGGWVMSTALNVVRRALRRRPMPIPRRQGDPDRGSATEL